MKISKKFDNNNSTFIEVEPWPDCSFAARVNVLHQKTSFDDWRPPVGVFIRYGAEWTTVQFAREWAEAILKACEIADEMIHGSESVQESVRDTPQRS